MSSENTFSGKKVLVAGATGFLGSNVARELLSRGALVRGTVRKRQPKINDPRLEYIQADLTLKEDCARAVAGMDYVMMCAASTAGASVMVNTPLAIVTPNVIMNALMLEAAYAAGVEKFLFVSTNAVYPVLDHAAREDEMMSGPPFEKYYPAAWMKRFGEILCETYSTKIKKPMKTVVVRPANAYGPLDNFDLETSHVVPALIRKVIERQKPLQVWGDGTDIKDLIYIDDLVRGILLAFEKIEEYNPVNIGTGVPVSVNDALRAALEADGYADAEIVYDASKPSMIPMRQLSTAKAEELLGFRAATSIKEGVAKTIAWYKKTYPNGYN